MTTRTLLTIVVASLLFALPAAAAASQITGDIQVTSTTGALVLPLSWTTPRNSQGDTIQVDMLCNLESGGTYSRLVLLWPASDAPFTFATSLPPGPSDCTVFMYYNQLRNNKTFATLLDSESFHVA